MTENSIRDNFLRALLAEKDAGQCFLLNAVICGEPLHIISNGQRGDEALYWSNEDGFVENGYEFYTKDEAAASDLPMGGRWISVPEAVAFEDADNKATTAMRL